LRFFIFTLFFVLRNYLNQTQLSKLDRVYHKSDTGKMFPLEATFGLTQNF